jgi:hypothetical protein
MDWCTGAVLKNRKLMNGCLVLLPVSNVLVWCTGALLYGALLNNLDLCNGLSVFLLNPAQQPNSQIKVDLFPCPTSYESSALRLSATQALLNMTSAANKRITGSLESSLLIVSAWLGSRWWY